MNKWTMNKLLLTEEIHVSQVHNPLLNFRIASDPKSFHEVS